MRIGSRVLYPEEVGRWDAGIVQISVYRGMQDNIATMNGCVRACREAEIPFVIHPVGFSILQEENLDPLRLMAESTDLSLILHDERAPGDVRLSEIALTGFRTAYHALRSIAPVSFENAANTRDVFWFWDQFAESITLDIGHVESSGLDSLKFVTSLDKKYIDRIEFVHMHRNNGLHGGITDHWPLEPDCREVRALEKLLAGKPGVSVILELNEVEQIGESLEILKAMEPAA